MPFQYRFLDAPPAAHIQLSGTVDLDVFVEAAWAVFTDPGWTYGGAAIWDMTDVGDRLVLSREDMDALGRTIGALITRAGPGRTFLVAPDPTAYAVSRLYQYQRRGAPRRIQVVRSLDEALRLLA